MLLPSEEAKGDKDADESPGHAELRRFLNLAQGLMATPKHEAAHVPKRRKSSAPKTRRSQARRSKRSKK